MYFQCDLEKVSQATLVRRVCLSMQTSFWWNKIALLRKKTYFTTSYGCGWDPKDSLSTAEYVWNSFQMTLFGKCDNASCYLGNPYPKLLYDISKQNRFFLKRLDYNKLYKGKYQCDWDSVFATNALRTNAKEGNNIMNAEIESML